MAKKDAAEQPGKAQKEAGRGTESIQIEKDLAKMVRVIAAHRDKTHSQVVSPVLRQFIEAQYALVIAEMQREVKGQKAAHQSASG